VAEFKFTASDNDRVKVLECRIDDQMFRVCSSPVTFTDLPDGDHILTIRAVDAEGNTARATHSWTIDTAAPIAITAKPSNRSFTFRATVPVLTRATDNGTGVDRLDVRWQRIKPNGKTGAWQYPAAWQNITATRLPSPDLLDGSTYCFSSRARDKAGNSSRWSAPRCIAKPLDDRALRGAGWARGSGAKFFNKTHTTTTKKNAVLRKASLRATQIGVVATRCPKCGTIGVYDDGRLIRKINLYASRVKNKQLILLPRTSRPRTGTFIIRPLTKDKIVRVDGLAVHQR